MLKAVLALSVAQTLVIGFLAARIVEFDERLHNTERTFIENAAVRSAALSGANGAPSGVAPANVETAHPSAAAPNADEIRNIIREEFAASRINPGAATAVATTPPAPVNPQRIALAQRSLQGLIAKRDVATRDLDRYLDAIAELPEADRNAALRSLTKAMNDGRINGHF